MYGASAVAASKIRCPSCVFKADCSNINNPACTSWSPDDRELVISGVEHFAKTAQSALAVQEGGDHYKTLKIQPIEYIHANSIPFAEGSVIKYVTRWRTKNGIADLKKARHFLDLLIELEERNDPRE